MPALQEKNLYGNCQVLHPDGHLMFRCDQKRLNWYLNRNLGTIVDGDPKIIKLSFMPKGDGKFGDPYYMTEKKNQCVVCGTKSDLTKHHCVPKCYRRFFPLSIKSRCCHDVLLVCYKCHHEYERYAYDLKRKLAVDYGLVEEFGKIEIAYKDRDRIEKMKIRGFALALLEHGDKIPADRKEYLWDSIKKCWPNLDEGNLLEFAADFRMPMKKSEWAHGKSIAAKVEDLDGFLKMWRQHFCDVMQPKFLPQHWDINHKLEIACEK